MAKEMAEDRSRRTAQVRKGVERDGDSGEVCAPQVVGHVVVDIIRRNRLEWNVKEQWPRRRKKRIYVVQ